MSYTRTQLEEWVKSEIEIPDNSKVLDIGGSQNPIKGRLNRVGKDVEFRILDLEIPHECKQEPDIIRDLNYDIDACIEQHKTFESDCEECGSLYHQDITNKFDIAFCLEVSEYWWNPFKALGNINYFLKEKGVLYLSTHFIYPIHNPYEQDYLRYTRSGIEKLLKEAGFEVEYIKPRLEKSNTIRSFYSNEGMRPSKDYDKHDEVGCLIKAVKN